MSSAACQFDVLDLGRVPYAAAFERQRLEHERVVAARERGEPIVGTLLVVVHDPPVITVSRRPGARSNLLATPELLARHGVEVAETDRGGDITYHGPGQLVAYPIFDLNTLGLNLHAYMRLLEQTVIDTCAALNIQTMRDPGATGVWTVGTDHAPHAKIAALGVRVRRWVTMHGLALNVTTNLDHFSLIVPCGLVGRPVTSLAREGVEGVSVESAKPLLVRALAHLVDHWARERAARDGHEPAAVGLAPR